MNHGTHRRPPLAAVLIALNAAAALLLAATPAPEQGNAAAFDLESASNEFRQHVTTLADPFFEGRSADTRGHMLATDYILFHFRRIGLTPAFSDPAADPALAAAEPSPFLQSFAVPGDLQINLAEAAYRADDDQRTLNVEDDFNPLGFSGKGRVEGQVVFVGYSIEDGPEGFSSYTAGEDLTGKIALMLRYEPADNDGTSRWSNFSGWSRHAGLMEKVKSAVTRGASGVILVNPPGVKDPRSKVLETAKATRFGAPIGVPAVMLSPEAARGMLNSLGGDFGLGVLRKKADAGGHGAVALMDQAGAPLTFSMNIEVDRASMNTHNVGAVINGRGALADQWIVLGAHYDHVGYGFVGGSNPTNQGTLHPGADDNASGVAGLLQAARGLKARYDALPADADARSIMLLAFGAEEMGLLGSEHFVRTTTLETAKVAAMVNMDMIGRLREDSLEVSGMGTAEEFDSVLTPIFDSSGLEVRKIKTGMGPSDHASFHRAGLPVLAFFTGLHPDYHNPGDTADKVNAQGGARIARLVEEVVFTLVTRPGQAGGLTFRQTGGTTPSPARGRARVRLGIMPGDYSGEQPGVLVGDVTEGTSAANAGMKKGDRIVRWGGEELADAGAMMQRLVSHKPGDVVEIVVVRDGQEQTLQVTLQGRGGSE